MHCGASDLKLKIGCWDYDRTRALTDSPSRWPYGIAANRFAINGAAIPPHPQEDGFERRFYEILDPTRVEITIILLKNSFSISFLRFQSVFP